MLVLRERLVGIPVMSLQTGTQIGNTVSTIIDPRRLTIVAFYCEGPLINFKPAILHTSDIREFSNLGFIVDSADDIMPPDDLVRLKEILDFNFSLEGRPVIEEDGRKLGKVENYTTETDTFYISKLHVRPSIWQSFTTAEMLIDRSQITKITDKTIIVKKATIKDTLPITTTVHPPVDNPFRRHAEAMRPEAHPKDSKANT